MTAATEKFRYWIDMSMECVRRDHTKSLTPGDQKGPFLTARALGMALAALNDANAHASGGTPLLGLVASPGLVGLAGKDIHVASAAACAQVLRLRYPNQGNMLEPGWLHWLEYFGFGLAGSVAEMEGRAFGNMVHQLGANDVANAKIDQYTPTGAPYAHTAPPNDLMQNYAGGVWGKSTRLLAVQVTGFPPPPGRISPATVTPTQHYRDDFDKVAAKGTIDRMTGLLNTRTLEEEVVGIAWGYDGPSELGTPPRLYLQVVLTVLDLIEARMPGTLSHVDELAIIAGVGIAMADAAIDAWHYKYSPGHMMWRPAVGIRNAQHGNGVADPSFLPLGLPDTNGSNVGLTPNFPAYPSGHATFGAAAFQLLRLFLGEKGVISFDPDGVDDMSFAFVSDEFDGRNRDARTLQPRDHLTLGYPSLWKAITDNSLSRVYLGVHWQFDGITQRNASNTDDEFGVPVPNKLGKTGGVWLGAQIANQIAPKLGVLPATITASGIS